MLGTKIFSYVFGKFGVQLYRFIEPSLLNKRVLVNGISEVITKYAISHAFIKLFLVLSDVFPQKIIFNEYMK